MSLRSVLHFLRYVDKDLLRCDLILTHVFFFLSFFLFQDLFPQNKNVPQLFKPITIRNMTFPNRIFVAPMCMYSKFHRIKA
jgi:hypothetical protein